MAMNSALNSLFLALLAAALLPAAAPGAPPPKTLTPTDIPESRVEGDPLVWIFMGLPGDATHEARYSLTVENLARTFKERFGVSTKDLTVLFGAGELKPHAACSAENLTRELDRIVARSKERRPIWLFFIGHSNSAKANVRFNIQGRDPSAPTIGERLSKAEKNAPMAIFLTTAASGKFLKPLAAPGRLLVTASEVQQKDNETEFPHALTETLGDPKSDLDGDGRLTVLEIFQETKRRVRESYEKGEYIQTERALLDGNGDGKGTARPAEKDAGPAGRFGLRTGTRLELKDAAPPPSKNPFATDAKP